LKTIGFFGGTFDPIHFGHIGLAIQLLEIHKLDEVLFCPAYCSPFKTAAPPYASPEHRLAMSALAIEGIPRFRITPYEIDRGDPSYTIDTLQVLKGESRGPVKFRLLLSEEAAVHFDQWKDFQELIRLAPPLIGTRSSPQRTAAASSYRPSASAIAPSAMAFDSRDDLILPRSPESSSGSLADVLRSGFTATKIFEISSTEIRARLKKGLYCGHLLPGKTLEYIQDNGLYSV